MPWPAPRRAHSVFRRLQSISPIEHWHLPREHITFLVHSVYLPGEQVTSLVHSGYLPDEHWHGARAKRIQAGRTDFFPSSDPVPFV